MSKQSHRQVIVAPVVTSPAADATTTALTEGQVGVFEVPSYKAKLDFNSIARVQIFQGTPDFETARMSGIPNFNRRTPDFAKTKIKLAKLIAPATKQNRVIALGYDAAVAATKTISLKGGGAKKTVHVTLSGSPVSQELGHTQGWTKKFIIESDPASDPLVNVAPATLADDLIAQIQNDPEFSKYLTLTKTTLSTTHAGVLFETKSVKPERPSVYQYHNYPYDNEVVHVEVNTWDENYNAEYTPDASEWPVTEKTALRYAQNEGEYVRELEKRSLSYELMELGCDPGTIDAEGFKFNASTTVNYDEYQFVVELDAIKTEGFGKVQDDRVISIFLPTGTGRAVGELGDVLSKLAVDAGLPALF